MGKRQSLTREHIVNQAIAIADKNGIEALSMRKLATDLNIQAMSLYHHFKTKDELLSCMADKLIGGMGLPDQEDECLDWRMILRKRAASARDLFRSHLWLPQVIDFQVHSGVKRLEYLDSYIGVLRKAGLSIEISLRAIALIDSFIYGYCRQLAHSATSSLTAKESAEQFASGFDASLYPYLSEASALIMRRGYEPEEEFDSSLELILRAIGLELER